jgi:hypothetical protein
MLQKLFELWFLSETKAKRLLCRMPLPPELYAAFTFLGFSAFTFLGFLVVAVFGLWTTVG